MAIARRTPIARSTKAIKRTPVKRRNAKRRKSEFARTYHSAARVLFVKALPCSACGVEGFSENAHLAPPGEKGTGYKAGYEFVAPLCGTHEEYEEFFGEMRVRMGCHKLHDRHPVTFRARFPDFNPVEACARCEAQWRESQA